MTEHRSSLHVECGCLPAVATGPVSSLRWEALSIHIGSGRSGGSGVRTAMDLGRFWDDVSRGYERHIVDEHKQPHVFILLAFLLTFTIVRVITHAIRAGK